MSEQIRNKLLNFEVPPPPGVWDNIAQELRESNSTLGLSQKMHAYEVAPPPMTWNRIAQQLTGNDQPELAVIRKTRKITYKLFMAAAFIGVIVAGGIYLNTGFIRKHVTGKLISAAQKKRSQLKSLVHKAFPLPESPALQPEQMSASASDYVFNKRKSIRLPEEDTRILRNAIVSMGELLTPPATVMVPAKPIRDESGGIVQNTGLIYANNKYVNVTGPNGEQTKISSKFQSALLYLNGDNETYFDEFRGYFDIPFIQSFVWKTRFKDWRKKIMQTPFIPSSTNFLDILEFRDFIMKEE